MPPTLPPLTLDALETWAKDKSPQSILGRSQKASACPVSTYLFENTGTRYAVYHYSIQEDCLAGGETYREPIRWARDRGLTDLLDRVDDLDPERPVLITREMFLAVLTTLKINREKAEVPDAA